NEGKGKYLRNRSRPSRSWTSARGRAGSSEVQTWNTEESIARWRPSLLVLLKISAKKRGLTVFCESQQGIRNATGRLPGILLRRSTQSWKVFWAAAKSPF